MDITHVKETPVILRQSYEDWRLDKQISTTYSLKDVNAVFVDKFPMPSEQSLKQIYESEKQSGLQNIQHKIQAAIITNSLEVLIGIILFFLHWIYIRKIVK